MTLISRAPSFPPLPDLQKRHPSRSVSPLPRPPALPKRVDKTHSVTRNNRQRLGNLYSTSFFGGNKKDKHQYMELPLLSSASEKNVRSSSLTELTNEDIIADLSAAEQSSLLTKLKSAVFHRSSSLEAEDDGSTSTATSESTLSDETCTSLTPVLGAAAETEVVLLNTASGIDSGSPLLSDRITVLVEQDFHDKDDSKPVFAPPRHVRFDTDSLQVHYLTEHIHELSQSDKDHRWYSRRDVAKQRKEMKQVILMVRDETNGADLFINDASLEPLSCVTGCERYYCAENRFMAQKMMVEAIVGNNGLTDEQLREISRNLSRPNREMAQWHAKLTAIQCWGLAGLKQNCVASATGVKQPLEAASLVIAPQTTPPLPSPRSPSIPNTPVSTRKVFSLGSLPSSDSPELCLPDMSKVSRGSSTFHLAPRIVPFALEENQCIEAALEETKEDATAEDELSRKSQQPKFHHAHNPVHISFSETLEKWQALSKSSVDLPAKDTGRRGMPPGHKQHPFGISCGVFQ